MKLYLLLCFAWCIFDTVLSAKTDVKKKIQELKDDIGNVEKKINEDSPTKEEEKDSMPVGKIWGMKKTTTGLDDYILIDDTPAGGGDSVYWLSSGKCGPNNPLPSGEPAMCNPEGEYPCCSDQGLCGNTQKHCDCATCIQYHYYK